MIRLSPDLVVDGSGVLGQAALDPVDDIGRHLHLMTGEPRSKGKCGSGAGDC